MQLPYCITLYKSAHLIIQTNDDYRVTFFDHETGQTRPPQIQRDALEVLIELDLQEGPEIESVGWQVAVVEHLRLQVPAEARQAWLEAEMVTWDPWLRQQKGFLGREVLWDNASEEGVLLIHWASREDWQAIPKADLIAIQQQFESTAKNILSLPSQRDNPFPLIFSGEAST